MPETVHLVADRKQKKEHRTRYFIPGLAPTSSHQTPFLLHNAIIHESAKELLHQSGRDSQDPSTFPNLTSWQTTPLMQEIIWGTPYPNWNGGGTCRWVGGYMDKPPQLLRKLTLAHSKVISAPAEEQPLGRGVACAVIRLELERGGK